MAKTLEEKKGQVECLSGMIAKIEKIKGEYFSKDDQWFHDDIPF